MKKVFSCVRPFYVLNIGASLLLQLVALILVYILTPEQYGNYALLTSVAQIMYILCSGWTNASVLTLGTKAYIENGSYKDIIIYRFFTVFACFVILCIAFLLLKAPIILFVGGSKYYYLTFLFFISLVLNDFVCQLLYPGGKNLIQACIVFFTNVFVLLYVLLFVENVETYIFGNAAMQLLLFAVIIPCFMHFFGRDVFLFNYGDFKCFIVFSLWQLLGVIGVYLINLSTNYVLRYYQIPVSDIGLYNFAYKLFCGFVPVFGLIAVLIPKWISNSTIVEKEKYIMKRMLYLVIFLSVLYICFYLLIRPFIHIIGKDDYQQSASMYIYLFPAFVFYSISQILNIITLNTRYYKHSQYCAILQGAILIVTNFFLVKIYGIIGAIMGTFISYLMGSIYLELLYTKKIRKYLLKK